MPYVGGGIVRKNVTVIRCFVDQPLKCQPARSNGRVDTKCNKTDTTKTEYKETTDCPVTGILIFPSPSLAVIYSYLKMSFV
jgi:hypothetical protein